MRPEFRSMKVEARAKSRALYEAANPITCSKCGRRFPKVKDLREHHHFHLLEKTPPVKNLGQSSSERQRSAPPTATPILPTPLFVDVSMPLRGSNHIELISHLRDDENMRRPGGIFMASNSAPHHEQGKSARQPELDPDGSVLKPLHVAQETSDGNKVAVPVGDKVQSSELKAPAGSSTGVVDTADEVKQLELDLSLHL